MSASCPVCNLTLPLSQLQRHANAHFENDEDDLQIAYDQQLALQISSSSSSPSFSDNFDDPMDIDEKVACLASLQTKSFFYSVRDGGLIRLLQHCLESEYKSNSKPLDCTTSLLSGYVDHFQSIPSEDVGWGCGWRNVQMLCSHLLSQREEARRVLFGGSTFVPDIPSLQCWLEIAWKKGFDVPGSFHFGNQIYGSNKWIGTTECAALLRSFGLRARIVDFGPKKAQSMYLSVPGSALAPKKKTYGPMDRYLLPKGECQQESSVDGHGSNLSKRKINREEILMDWVWDYFSNNSLDMCQPTSSRVFMTNKAPLYFQHEGHSRTIIGIQKHQRGLTRQYNLLVLDPAHRSEALEKALVEKGGWQKYIKRGVQTLKQPEYQLLYVDDGIACGEEMERLKTISSLFVEF